MGLLQSLTGEVRAKVICAEPEILLSRLNAEGIILRDVEYSEPLTIVVIVKIGDLKTTQSITSAYGGTIEVVSKEGIYWSIQQIFKRPFLIFGIILLTFLITYIPTRIFFIEVEGNVTIPDKYILEQARLCGVTFGVECRAIRSEEVKNSLLQIMPELRWVGVNTCGCVATISVEEREVLNNSANEIEKGVSSLIAAYDGIIQEVLVKKGDPLCQRGQAVKAGQTLVSGYTDCGLSVQATQAEGEIYALTSRKLCLISPTEHSIRGEFLSVKKNIYLQVGKKLINLYNNSGISDASCVKICNKKPLTLPGGFSLPVALIVESYYFYEIACGNEVDHDQFDWVSDYAENYLGTQMIAGQILNIDHSEKMTDNYYMYESDYICREMIAFSKQEEIFEINGKDD